MNRHDERVLAEIEKHHLRTLSNGKKLVAKNMACGELYIS